MGGGGSGGGFRSLHGRGMEGFPEEAVRHPGEGVGTGQVKKGKRRQETEVRGSTFSIMSGLFKVLLKQLKKKKKL